jgi:organic hydroperoxide reductase OsmC/OhrA
VVGHVAAAAADEARARRLVATAERHCIISNALRVPVRVDVAFRPTPALDRTA